jgi:hypothetical protein
MAWEGEGIFNGASRLLSPKAMTNTHGFGFGDQWVGRVLGENNIEILSRFDVV